MKKNVFFIQLFVVGVVMLLTIIDGALKYRDTKSHIKYLTKTLRVGYFLPYDKSAIAITGHNS